MEGAQVAIIGAGISGLLACKYTLSKGFKPIVFESRSSIGGVWIKTVETTKLQTPKPFFQFCDYPWPESVTEDFPNQHQVLDYIDSYARHFDLLKHIKFDTKVLGIEYEGPSEEEMESWSLWGGNGEPFASKGKWKVEVEDTQCHSNQVYIVDFVILCIGRFSDVPNIPEFPPNKGPEAFHGNVIHSMEYAALDYKSAAEFVKGKQVTVVGLQKSALDIAMECSDANGLEKPCTVLYKTEHWNVPDYFPWGFPLAYLYLNRFSELLVHKPGEGILLSLLATFLSPLRWAISKFVESHIKNKLRLAKYGMVPEHGFLQQISSCLISTVPEKFYDRVEEGSIILKKSGANFSFCQEGVLVNGEETPLKTDLVILATGFNGDKKLKDIFMSSFFQDHLAGSPNAAVPLYRECIHPRIPQLAVIGFSESVSNLYTSEIRCRWLSELLAGTFKLPSIKEMEEDVKKWDEYLKNYSGQYYRRSCIGALHIWYNDQLCKDMGWKPKRKKGFFAELFEPYGPMDYASI
ncbi:hypothetical protein FNV43_RR21936 [Rhamnella rubrinervis]|uniref:Flavin-containing monooxygenase n=1 Tax=Rhamnella rubrinervis TaxID=2594499 RepID=A0A8K0DV66_9ROSA|nr:hypothetical protein FNV43_RR21936 [Rhamnella rubrinervis]